MDNLLLNVNEYRYIRKHKLNFETRYHVKLILPEIDAKNGYCASDVIFATIHGEKSNIGIVKDRLKLKTAALKAKQDCVMSSSNVGDNVPVITLSDSDSDSPSLTAVSDITNIKNKRKKKFARVANPSVSSATEASSSSKPNSKRKFTDVISSSTKLISLCTAAEEIFTRDTQGKCEQKKFKGQLNMSVLSVNQSITIANETIGTSSTITSEKANESVVILDEWGPIDEYIPLNSGKNKKRPIKKSNFNGSKNNQIGISKDVNDSVIILDDDINELSAVTVPRPIANEPKRLRPIVIDGSNVARTHGKALNTFSCKGIQISVDYFLQRGHTQITVFVPHFRRFKTLGHIPTTDPIILEDLEKCQRIVFTPSRNINGKRITCYDDRFIVELASKNNGIILSNDNYKDLLDCSAEFKKTIEERLLMFLFVEDMIMIPNDPLGRDGPCLDDFLSFPPEKHSPT